MSSSKGGIGSTLTSGIQDIAAILPLLGTEQCSVQVSSALTRGYLYAAATPMSIFGSLGVVRAGFKTFVACFSFGDFEGAKILGHMGFEPQGENLSLIMVEAGKGKNAGRYIIETRMDELIKELNIDKKRIRGVSHKSTVWNIKMMATTALLCALSIVPYIYLNRGANNLAKSATWVFPVVRAAGGFIVATLIQLLIQRRITILSEQYLVKRDQLPNPDVEAALETKKYKMDACTWLLLSFLLIGLVASVVGYVGCFSVVQNSTSTFGPLSWLCLEVGLSVMRLIIWAWNPTRHNAPPLEIIFELDKYEHKPLPTCNKDNAEILQSRVLPLTRARDFLGIITSFAGLIEPFSNPDLSLYYTLTRNCLSKRSVPAEAKYGRHNILPWKRPPNGRVHADIEINKWNREHEPENVDSEKHQLGERTLYITVFDHKERTTRVYTRDDEIDTFYSTKSDAPLVDVGHYLLEVEIDAEIDPKGDPVSRDSNNLESLRKHHRSILEHIQYRLGAGDVTKPYAIENSWTMKVEDTISTTQRLKEEKRDDWRTIVEKGKEEEQNEENLLISEYFMHSSIERERRLLDEIHVKWIAYRMEMIHEEMFQGEMGVPVEYRVNMQAVERKPAPATKSREEIQMLQFHEQYFMGLLLLYEVKEWEKLFWKNFKAFLDEIDTGNDRVEEKERLTREWRANCWKRLSPQMHAAEEWLAEFDSNTEDRRFPSTLLKDFRDVWASSISELFEGGQKPYSSSISLSELRDKMGPADASSEIHEVRLRIEKEIEDTEFRLKRGSDSGRFDQFWDDYSLFQCRYSRSKWLYLSPYLTNAPLEVHLHALKGNKNIIHVTFGRFDSESDVNQIQAAISNLPWVTSISFDTLPTLPIHRDLLFINSINNDLITFAKEIRPKLDPQALSTYIFTYAVGYDILSGSLTNDAKVLISFVAPTSGQGLILRLKHSSSIRKNIPLEFTLGKTIIQLNPSSKSSLTPTIDDIILSPINRPSEPGRLLFEPEIRNDIVIQFRRTVETGKNGHLLYDKELLDETGLEYRPHSASLSWKYKR